MSSGGEERRMWVVVVRGCGVVVVRRGISSNCYHLILLSCRYLFSNFRIHLW